MQAQERYSDLLAVLNAATARALGNTWTAMPGYIVDFDAESCTATVQLGIKITVSMPDGTSNDQPLSLLVNVPIIFTGGGGTALTFPIKPDDEVLVVFTSRCADDWKQSGGTQSQSQKRFHDLSDGFAIPGYMSQAKKLSNVSTSTTQLRSEDGESYVELDPTGHIVNVLAPGGFNVTGPAKFSETVTAVGDVIGAGVSLSEHLTSGVQSGSGTSGPPIP